MRCRVVLLLLCWCAMCSSARNIEGTKQKRTTTAVSNENSCDDVRSFFLDRSMPLPVADTTSKGSLCGGQCCGAEIESSLRRKGQEQFATMLRHNSQSLQGLLNSTATIFQNYLMELAGFSENRTLEFFSIVYRNKFLLNKSAIKNLYSDIKRYVQINSSQDVLTNTNVDIQASVLNFFTEIFPLAYHNTLPDESKHQDFSPDYIRCLKETMNLLQPFSDIPKQITQSLSKGLDAARLLLQAFGVGVEVLNATDTLIIVENGRKNVECHDVLMKMTYCPMCLDLKGNNTKPCSGYCLNVLRGCLTRYVAELDLPWNSYVEGVERLVVAMKQKNNEGGVNADAVFKNLEARISDAIMLIMKSLELHTKVKKSCGAYKFKDARDASWKASKEYSETLPKNRSHYTARQSTGPQDTQLNHFLESIDKSRGFYANLADNICKDENFADASDLHCWNGDRIGEYTKMVVDAGLDTQKYNPEVKQDVKLQNIDMQVASLADKLRHVQQLVMSSLGATGILQSDNYMQGDGAEGSGSGNGSDFNDEDDDDISPGSGSGDKPIENPKHNDIEDNDISRTTLKPRGSGSNNIKSNETLLVLLLSMLIASQLLFHL